MRGSHAWLRPGAVFLAALAVAVACPAIASGAEQYPPVRYENYQRTHRSGLRVVAYRFTGMRLTSVAVSVLGGQQAEPPGKEGVAEIVGRLLSGQTGRADGDDEDVPSRPSVGQRLVAEASDFETRVELDSILFTARAPSGKLGPILALEAERLRDPLAGVEPEVFERVRARLLEEITGAEAVPDAERAMWVALGRVLSEGVARRRPATPDSVKAISWKDVEAYVAANFRPERMLVVVVGPLAGRTVEAAVDGAFGAGLLTRAEPVAPASWEAGAPFEERDREEASLVVVPGPVQSPRLWLAWEFPGGRMNGMRLIGVGLAMAMERLAPATKGLGKAEGAAVVDLGQSAVLTATVQVESEEDARKVLEGFSRAWSGRWLASDVAVAMDAAATRFFHELETIDATTIARMVRRTDDLDPVDALRTRLTAPVPAGMGDQVRRMLGPFRTLAVLEVPPPAGKSEARARSASSHGAEEGGEREGASPPWIYRLPPGKYDVYSIAQPPGLSAAWREKLENGLEVVGLPRPGYPKMTLELVVPMDGDAPAGLPALALASLRPPPGIRCERIEGRSGSRSATWTVKGFAGYLYARADNLNCSVAQARVDPKVFEKARDAMYAARKKIDKAHSRSALRAEAAAQALLAQGRAGLAYPRAGEIDDLTSEQAEAWVRAQLRPDRATLFVVGDIPPQEEAMALLRVRFGDWAVAQAPRPAPPPALAPPVPPTRRAIFHAEHEARRTASVVIHVGWTPPAAPDDAADAVVMAELERRLLRAQGSGIRRPDVQRSTFSAYPMLVVAFDAAPERAGEATRKALEVIRTQAEAPALAENVAFRRWILASRFPLRFADVGSVADRLAEQAARGLPPEWWDRFPASISGLGTERVEASSARLLPGKEIVLVLGDDEKSLESLRAAGFTVERP